jgi:hypothetical protein
MKRVIRVYRNIQEIAKEYEQARARAHAEYFYSMRDTDAAEMLGDTLNRLDQRQSYELRQFQTRRAALESRRRELRAA